MDKFTEHEIGRGCFGCVYKVSNNLAVKIAYIYDTELRREESFRENCCTQLQISTWCNIHKLQYLNTNNQQ